MLSMRWSIVFEIFRREVRDQLRDRRTLFMIFVLPILLYPMLGLGIAQLSVAFQQRPRTVVVLGAGDLPDAPPLLNAQGDGFDESLFDIPQEVRRYQVIPGDSDPTWSDPRERQRALSDGLADVVLLIPTGLRDRVDGQIATEEIPIAFFSGDERSLDTARAVRDLIETWKNRIVTQRAQRDEKPEGYLHPVEARPVDVARGRQAGAALNIWARFFPFLLVLMSLTGAFYPAVDLCAGEKERGTMETLLISPATRPEIVTGKFLTVVLASMASAILNLVSMGLTALALSRQIGMGGAAAGSFSPAAAISAPSLESAFWMVLILIPLAVFFSALCMALAAMARSMKEGQYYLTPLYLVTLPLVFATLAPGVELNPFTSLVPVTGASLLLRTLMIGDYSQAQRYFLIVLVPLVVYAALALRWAVDQFRSEAVLFREAERFDLRGWFRHIIRDRGPTPSSGEALLCFVLMLGTAWFAVGLMGASWQAMVGGQLIFILLPPLILTALLTRSPRRTLLLNAPRGRDLALAIGLVLAIQPLVAELRVVVETFFPIPETVKEQLMGMMETIPSLGIMIFVFALVPAVCEEVAFRGFILQGLRRDFRLAPAIVLSAFLFGFLHVLLSLSQQLFNATLLGLVLGLLAVRSNSLVPGLVFHALHNTLALLVGVAIAGEIGGGFMKWVFREPREGLYHGPWLIVGTILTVTLLIVLYRMKPAVASGKTIEPQPSGPTAAIK